MSRVADHARYRWRYGVFSYDANSITPWLYVKDSGFMGKEQAIDLAKQLAAKNPGILYEILEFTGCAAATAPVEYMEARWNF
jgi:hypothetical protein